MERKTHLSNIRLSLINVFLIWLIFKVIAITLSTAIVLMFPGINLEVGKTIMTLAQLIIFISFIAFKYQFNFSSVFNKLIWKQLSYALGLVLLLIIFQRVIGTYFEIFDYDSHYSNSGIRIIGAVILAPVFEEIFFRGFLLEGTLRKYTPVTSILFISVLFAISHYSFSYGIGNMILQFTTGLLFGCIYYRTRSVVLCILLHALYNGLALFLYTL